MQLTDEAEPVDRGGDSGRDCSRIRRRVADPHVHTSNETDAQPVALRTSMSEVAALPAWLLQKGLQLGDGIASTSTSYSDSSPTVRLPTWADPDP